MKPTHHIASFRHLLATILLGALFMQGCFKEDMSKCGIAVRFKWDKNVSFTNRFGFAVQRIDLFVFDGDGNFFQSHSVQASQVPGAGLYLPTDYAMVLTDLPPGNYTFVAWGNVSSVLSLTPQLRESTTFTSSLLNLNVATGSMAPRTHNMTLFHGCVQQRRIEGGLFGTEDVLIDLTKFTNHIQVEITTIGKPESITNLDYKCAITSKNGSYRYNGNYANDNVITYDPYPATISSNGTVHNFDFTILREVLEQNGVTNPTESRFMVNLVRSDGTEDELIDESLIDILKATEGMTMPPWSDPNTGNPDIDDEYRIEITLEYSDENTGATVTVTINNWESAGGKKPIK